MPPPSPFAPSSSSWSPPSRGGGARWDCVINTNCTIIFGLRVLGLNPTLLLSPGLVPLPVTLILYDSRINTLALAAGCRYHHTLLEQDVEGSHDLYFCILDYTYRLPSMVYEYPNKLSPAPPP